MNRIKHLLLENKAWSKSQLDINPDYFKDMAKDQNPEYLVKFLSIVILPILLFILIPIS